jgi:hypothetical protein
VFCRRLLSSLHSPPVRNTIFVVSSNVLLEIAAEHARLGLITKQTQTEVFLPKPFEGLSRLPIPVIEEKPDNPDRLWVYCPHCGMRWLEPPTDAIGCRCASCSKCFLNLFAAGHRDFFDSELPAADWEVETPWPPPLLAMLWATVTDGTTFSIGDHSSETEEYKAVFTHLYQAAAVAWDEDASAEKTEYAGTLLFDKFDDLSTCWLDCFRQGIRKVAAMSELPVPKAREFLYFMLGYLACGRDESLRQAGIRGEAPRDTKP